MSKSVLQSRRFGIYFGNLLKIAVKKLNLSINFVKNELLHDRLLKILRTSIYGIIHVSFYGTYTFSLLVLAEADLGLLQHPRWRVL